MHVINKNHDPLFVPFQLSEQLVNELIQIRRFGGCSLCDERRNLVFVLADQTHAIQVGLIGSEFRLADRHVRDTTLSRSSRNQWNLRLGQIFALSFFCKVAAKVIIELLKKVSEKDAIRKLLSRSDFYGQCIHADPAIKK